MRMTQHGRPSVAGRRMRGLLALAITAGWLLGQTGPAFAQEGQPPAPEATAADQPAPPPAPEATAAPPPAPEQPPVVPRIDQALKDRLRGVYQSGVEAGRRPQVFAKIGDSITASTYFLEPVGCGYVDL